jgi:hypothetical protein
VRKRFGAGLRGPGAAQGRQLPRLQTFVTRPEARL